MVTQGYARAALLGAVVLILGACAATAGEPTAGSTVEVSVDYPSFDSRTVVDSATLIVEGTALSIEHTVITPRFEGDTPERNPLVGLSPQEQAEAIEEADGVAATVVTFRVEVVHKGAVEPGDEIAIVQSGGVVDGVTYHSARDVMLEPEASYLLFGANSFDGAFHLLGGSAGSFRATGSGEYAAVSEGAAFERLTREQVDTLTGSSD